MTEPRWWEDALCPQIGIDLFFLNDGEPGAEAKRVCGMCPVRTECLADSITTPVPYGIFGGFGRVMRDHLTTRVLAGAHPTAVARAAIARERVQREDTDAARRAALGRGDRPAVRQARRPQEERLGVPALGLRAAG